MGAADGPSLGPCLGALWQEAEENICLQAPLHAGMSEKSKALRHGWPPKQPLTVPRRAATKILRLNSMVRDLPCCFDIFDD